MPKTILVAEDGKATREMLALLLSNHGYRVVEVRNGMEAWEQVKTVLPDLVVLDSEMPGLSGYEVFRRMHEDPDCKKIPVVFLVAGLISELSTKSLPPLEFLMTKPFKAHQLLERVKSLLHGREPGDGGDS